MKIKQHETGRQGVRRSPAETIFRKRANSIYAGMKRRAAAANLACVDREAFMGWLLHQFSQKPEGAARCFYSGEILSAENFMVDHFVPIGRGGSFYCANLVVCSEKENLRKGDLDGNEYRYLRSAVGKLSPSSQESIWRRLQVGDVQRFGYFRRQREKRTA